MGANGSFANKVTGTEEGRRYKTITAIGDNIKILEPKQVNGAIKLPEESHSPNRIYVTAKAAAPSRTVNCVQSVPMITGTITRSWWWKTPASWQPTKRRESTMVFTMFFMARFPRCLASAPTTYG